MKNIFIIIVMVMSVNVMAGTLNCTGKIENVLGYNHGGINVKPSWHSTHVRVCLLNSTWKTITPATCNRWFAALQTAAYLKKDVMIQYVNTSVTSCDQMPAMGAADGPGHINFIQ